MSKSSRARVAIIGSGFGGLAAAIRLQAAGVSTTIFETRDLAGGRAYVFREQGFTFDAGPTVITAPETLEELFEVAGINLHDAVELLPVTPFYRLIWPDGDVIDYAGGEALFEEIARRNPSDRDGYAKFVDYSKRVFDTGYTELAHVPFLRFADMLRCAPELMKLRADRSVYKTVARFVNDEKLRQALSFHSLLVGGNPFETSAIYTLIHYLERKWGVFFPRGGTGALVQALVDLYKSLGGDLRLSSPVQSVEVRGGLHVVTTTRGEESFDKVVSNADLHHTYSKLYRSHPAAAKTTKKLEKADWSMSLFVLYFGTNCPYDIAHHTVLFGERYEALLRDIFHGDHLPADFSLYLHAPTVTDPSLAPPGCGAFYVLSPVPHLGNANIDWEKEAPVYAEKILASLERIMPELRKHVVVKRWFTPLDFKETLVAYEGSAFSVAPKLTQSAWFRPHNKDPKIEGLYLVGAGTHPGAGVPGVLSSAKATASLVLHDLAAEEEYVVGALGAVAS
ncbi:MAG: phytoene desaturase [Polyangiaceae bacterium]